MLSQMFKQLFMGNPLTVLPVVALGIFMGTFLLISVRALLRRGSSFEGVARLPLDDGEVRRER